MENNSRYIVNIVSSLQYIVAVVVVVVVPQDGCCCNCCCLCVDRGGTTNREAIVVVDDDDDDYELETALVDSTLVSEDEDRGGDVDVNIDDDVMIGVE